jgi:hypothetical protein
MAKERKDRQSVSLERKAKHRVAQIAEATGVSTNRVIEKAVDLYSLYFQVQAQGEVLAFVVQPPSGDPKMVHFLVT